MSLAPPYSSLKIQLSGFLKPKQIVDNPYLCLAYGTDASFYRLIPKLVLKLDNIEQVQKTIQACSEYGLAYTFRAAGTSLSGQAISDSVLITLTNEWRGHEIIDNGAKIRLEPGVVGADANRYLFPYSKKIGPDPASIDTCKIGGIAANNSSGMCCGTADNSYQTVTCLKVILSDGTLLDTGDSDSIERFRHSHKKLLDKLVSLREACTENPSLLEKIKHKYLLKNTTGYSLNALIDFEDPIHILEHLIIGSEGTLGFLVDITYRTIDIKSHKATSLVVFSNIEDASLAVEALSKHSVDAVELMDGRALASIAEQEGVPEFLRQVDHEACALLIECSANSEQALLETCSTLDGVTSKFSLVGKQEFTQDPDLIASLWKTRKGLLPSVGAIRKLSSSVIIEDVAFPIEKLANGVRELQSLFEQYHYNEAIIFGHALDGNLHFVFTQNFDTSEAIEQYRTFMEEVTELVAVKYQGSLKAEHGTGRNMAPFVELEWGKDAYRLMLEIKSLFDPLNLMNPGVIINTDSNAHLKDLKPMPATHSNVDPCMECGFCEPVCPSKTLSLSPRQRIVLYRELQGQQAKGAVDPELEKLFDYQGIETCAVTGLCESRCPISINTGTLIDSLRSKSKSNPIAKWSANNFDKATQIARWGLTANQWAGKAVGAKNIERLTRKLNKPLGTPVLLSTLPPAAKQIESQTSQYQNKVIYFPTCVSRTLGSNNLSLSEVFHSICQKAGIEVILPQDLDALCCGKPYASMGDKDLAKQKSLELELALKQLSEDGQIPIVFDASPCALESSSQFSGQFKLFDSCEFVAKEVMEKLELNASMNP